MKKLLSLILSLSVLLSITVGTNFSAYASHFGDAELIYCQEMPVAAILDGTLYLIQGKSLDGKQEPKKVKIADNVKQASSVYVDSDKAVIAILWIDGKSIMNSYCFSNESGYLKNKLYGDKVSDVSSVFDYGYLKNNCVYYPIFKKGKLSFKEAKYLGEELGNKKVKIHSKVKSIIGNAIVLNKKSYLLGLQNSTVDENVENTFKYWYDHVNFEVTNSRFIYSYSYYANGKSLYCSATSEKISGKFKKFCDYSTYLTTDGKKVSIADKEIFFTIEDNYIAKVVNGTLNIYDTKLKNESIVTNNKIKKVSDNIENVYYAGFLDLCSCIGSFTGPFMFDGKYFSFYYSKKDGSFWAYYFDSEKSIKNGKSVCIISKKEKPKSTTINSVTAASKGFVIKWKKQTSKTTGYQIQYATNSKFSKNCKTVTISKNSTTSKKLRGLKAKTKYYVRIRTYKKANGKKYYSSWSKVKSLTTKK